MFQEAAMNWVDRPWLYLSVWGPRDKDPQSCTHRLAGRWGTLELFTPFFLGAGQRTGSHLPILRLIQIHCHLPAVSPAPRHFLL